MAIGDERSDLMTQVAPRGGGRGRERRNRGQEEAGFSRGVMKSRYTHEFVGVAGRLADVSAGIRHLKVTMNASASLTVLLSNVFGAHHFRP
jgi:hypothetical protein